ncbi:MAG: hypothetical protein ACXVAW_00935 [Vulcanimicrobiaceae bacterium]
MLRHAQHDKRYVTHTVASPPTCIMRNYLTRIMRSYRTRITGSYRTHSMGSYRTRIMGSYLTHIVGRRRHIHSNEHCGRCSKEHGTSDGGGHDTSRERSPFRRTKSAQNPAPANNGCAERLPSRRTHSPLKRSVLRAPGGLSEEQPLLAGAAHSGLRARERLSEPDMS